MSVAQRAIGAPLARVEGREKVEGRAQYAAEHNTENLVHAVIVRSMVAKGTVTAVGELDDALLVLSHANAPRINPVSDGELNVLQNPRIHYRGQIVACVVAETLEAAQEGARVLRVTEAGEPHDVVLTADHPGLYKPDGVNGGYETDSVLGDPDFAPTIDVTYATPTVHNNAMEPHATVARWVDGRLIVNDSTQGAWGERGTLAEIFGLEPEQVTVVSPHVGGGFGSKGTPRPHVVVAAMAAKELDRPVKLAVTRQQMFALTGYRTPTVQRIRIAAGDDGVITGVSHEAFSQTSQLKEFTEQTATATRVMYAGEHRRTAHRVTRLDVPSPSWYRAPGETPGMFGLECAMDELADELGLDPVELRIRNDPPQHPETGKPWSSRNLVACLREGAERFGWRPEARLEGRRRHGAGVAASMYPVYRAPAWAYARRDEDGGVTVRIAAADIGTGARTVLTQIAADACGLDPDRVRMEIGNSDFPRAGVAGGSMGTSSWGSAVHGACRRLVDEDLAEADYDTRAELEQLGEYARHAFGAQFCEVSVDVDTAEVRVERHLGVFATGRIVNPSTARSQFIGGITQGIGMALMEETIVDREFGDFLNHDLAQYHVPVHADVRDIEVHWIDEDDPHLNPMGTKGIGEIGITGAAAAVANAVYHATGVRVRRLPVTIGALI